MSRIADAEILWAMKVAHSDFSFSSCENMGNLSQKMFPNHPVANQFRLGQSKVFFYLVSDGLGPYFRKELCKDIVNSNTFFTVQYNETANAQVKEQCDILVRYWSESKMEVVVRFLKALMFGHAKAADLSKGLLSMLQKPGCQLPLSHLVMLCSDGLNVNKSVWNIINEQVKEAGFPGLLTFLPCNIHVAHNAFRKGLAEFGEEVEQLSLDIFYWFKLSACRRKDFKDLLFDLGLHEETFIRHVQSWWLTLLKSLEKIAKKWEVIKNYFLQEVPKLAKKDRTEKALELNERYKSIYRKLKVLKTLVQLQFLISVGPLFNKFLLFFQTEGPLIHTLHDEMSELVKSFMNRFVKKEVIGNKSGKQLMTVNVENSENLLPEEMVETGAPTRTALSAIPREQRKLIILGMKKFFQVVVKHLVDHFPLDSQFLQDLSCLHPLMRSVENGARAIRWMALKLPQVITEDEVALVTDEWKVYEEEELPEEWYMEQRKVVDEQGNSSAKQVHKRVDHYWRRIFQLKRTTGEDKYVILPWLVKSALCLAHGNADVERSLSANKRTVFSDRVSLSVNTINGSRLTEDVVQAHGGKVESVLITSGMRTSAKQAHTIYTSRLAEETERKKSQQSQDQLQDQDCQERESAERARLEKEKSLEDKEKALALSEKEQREELLSAEKLFGEANTQLREAIKKKDFTEAGIAQGLLDVARGKMEAARKSLEKCTEK